MENIINNPGAEFELPEIPDIENYDMAEWLFQFDNDEPVVIAWSNTEEEPGELTFTLRANSESSIIFSNSDGTKKLTLYARKMSEERREELRIQRAKEQEILDRLNSETKSEESSTES